MAKKPKAPKAAPAPTQSAASKKASAEADKAEQPPVYRVDLGEALPPQGTALNPNRAK